MGIVKKEFDSRQAWLEARQQGVGASEASTILGLNPYQKEKALLVQKTAHEVIESPSNPAMREGSEREPFILSLYENYTNTKLVIQKDCFYVNSKYPLVFASLDGEIHNDDGSFKRIVEAKLVRNDEIWAEVQTNTIPAHFQAQLQQLMAVCEPTDKATDIIFYNPKVDQFKILTLDQNEEGFKTYYELVKEFWVKVEGTKPEDLQPEASADLVELVRQLKAAQEKEDLAGQEVESLKLTIKETFKARGKDSLYFNGQPLVSETSFTTKRFDARAFQKEEPESYELYLKETASTRFTVRTENV